MLENREKCKQDGVAFFFEREDGVGFVNNKQIYFEQKNKKSLFDAWRGIVCLKGNRNYRIQ